MRKIAVMDTRTIVIGRVGENQAAQVVWPGLLAKWRGLYGEGTVQLAVRRPLDKSPYPAVCEVSGDDVTWTVSAADTAQNGSGECELSYLVGDTVAKSQTWGTMILRSLTGDEPGEPPEDPAKAWFAAIQSQIGDLNDLTTKAKQNLVSAINEAAKSGSGGGGSVEMRVADGYIQYSADGGTWENLIAVADLKGDTGPAGADGKPGADGKDGITPTIGSNGNWYLGTTDTGKPSRGEQGPAGKDGADGKDGAAGSPGKDGVTPNIQIGTVTTLAAGSDATASMTGTAAEPLLNLGIPKGADGTGGSAGFRMIANIELTEQSDRVDISTDSDGNTFALSEVYCFVLAQSYMDENQQVFFLPNGGWTVNYPSVGSCNTASKSSDGWKNAMGFHAVYGDGVLFAEQLPAKGNNGTLYSVYKINNSIISSVSFACKFAAGCTFTIIGR